MNNHGILLQLSKIKEEIQVLVDKCKKLVGAFNHNNVLRKALHQVQQELAYSVRIQLQGECNTRFNYRYTMLDSIVSNEKALCQMLTNVTINKGLIGHVPTTTEFILINDLCNLMFPLQDFISTIGASNYPTMSFLYPLIYKLENSML